ncbi:tripartite tricarboxylate transporter substrate-binding protein [Pigmentiphaga sp. NML080357]|uniref:tripartite tricarboxylate transporter substrate-binding protein n=1 Tax=Pigmentiphaga sp. NML080357 TaxID=2008675 RepID=UPI001E509DD9|nr:tripartite tricarboxylate transporter substrate-binding protein [Pigmentiphaga sp. NML080357]
MARQLLAHHPGDHVRRRAGTIGNDVPAVTEIGGEENTIPHTYFGFALPAGAPAAVRDQLSLNVRQVLADPAIRAKLADGGFEPAQGTPEEMRATVERDIAAFGRLARTLNIQPE